VGLLKIATKRIRRTFCEMGLEINSQIWNYHLPKDSATHLHLGLSDSSILSVYLLTTQ
jgi:hypothetical protein